MSHWQQRELRWAIKTRDGGQLVGCRAGGPMLAKTRKEARFLVRFNKMRDVEVIKVRVKFEEAK